MKYFLRELPDPILTLDYMDAFCQLDSKLIIIYPSVGKYYFPNRDSLRYFSDRARNELSAEIVRDKSRFGNRTFKHFGQVNFYHDILLPFQCI